MLKTASGFEYEIDEDAISDIELLEGLSAMEEGGAAAVVAMPKTIEKLLGKDGKKRLYDHCRNKKGRVPIEDVSKEVVEMFQSFSNDKKK